MTTWILTVVAPAGETRELTVRGTIHQVLGTTSSYGDEWKLIGDIWVRGLIAAREVQP